MVKKFCKLLSVLLVMALLVIVTLLLCSCGENIVTISTINPETYPINSETHPTNSEQEMQLRPLAPSYDWFVSEGQAAFMELVQGNPIDKSYAEATCDSSTAAMVEMENEFAAIWLSELEYSCQALAQCLNQEERSDFANSQDVWFSNLVKDMELLQSIYSEQDNRIKLGSTFQVECAVYYHRSIRERTLEVKYILYRLTGNIEFHK